MLPCIYSTLALRLFPEFQLSLKKEQSEELVKKVSKRVFASLQKNEAKEIANAENFGFFRKLMIVHLPSFYVIFYQKQSKEIGSRVTQFLLIQADQLEATKRLRELAAQEPNVLEKIRNLILESSSKSTSIPKDFESVLKRIIKEKIEEKKELLPEDFEEIKKVSIHQYKKEKMMKEIEKKNLPEEIKQEFLKSLEENFLLNDQDLFSFEEENFQFFHKIYQSKKQSLENNTVQLKNILQEISLKTKRMLKEADQFNEISHQLKNLFLEGSNLESKIQKDELVLKEISAFSSLKNSNENTLVQEEDESILETTFKDIYMQNAENAINGLGIPKEKKAQVKQIIENHYQEFQKSFKEKTKNLDKDKISIYRSLVDARLIEYLSDLKEEDIQGEKKLAFFREKLRLIVLDEFQVRFQLNRPEFDTLKVLDRSLQKILAALFIEDQNLLFDGEKIITETARNAQNGNPLMQSIAIDPNDKEAINNIKKQAGDAAKTVPILGHSINTVVQNLNLSEISRDFLKFLGPVTLKRDKEIAIEVENNQDQASLEAKEGSFFYFQRENQTLPYIGLKKIIYNKKTGKTELRFTTDEKQLDEILGNMFTKENIERYGLYIPLGMTALSLKGYHLLFKSMAKESSESIIDTEKNPTIDQFLRIIW